MNKLKFHYRWHFECSSGPSELWPLLSDTNRLFKNIGFDPVQKILLKRNLPGRYFQLASGPLHKFDAWIEKPCEWEAPFGFTIHRKYKQGHFRELSISVEQTRIGSKTQVAVNFSGSARNRISLLRIKSIFNQRLKNRLKKTLKAYDRQVSCKEPDFAGKILNPVLKRKKWKKLVTKLTNAGVKHFNAINLIQYLVQTDDQKLLKIEPSGVATDLNLPLGESIDLLLTAARVEILNFSWELLCPECRECNRQTDRLEKITEPLYCTRCKTTYHLDFNKTVRIVFHPHPLVRKLSDKRYSFNSPSGRPHLVMRQIIDKGKKQFLNTSPGPGKYKLVTDGNTGTVFIDVKPGAPKTNLIRLNEHGVAGQKISVASVANLVIHNQVGRKLLVTLESLDWLKTVSAGEVTSLQRFRNYFPNELIREDTSFHAGDVTIMFTDIFNSAQIYSRAGDESATRQMINHFETLRRVIESNRGAIIKTIGDSVMAIFRSPLFAAGAFFQAQNEIDRAGDSESIKLKAGLHSGDCLAVTLNNRIDYFGNTVNIAARLVEQASENELVISKKVFYNSDMQFFLNKHGRHLNIRNFNAELKGIGGESYELKKITARA